MTMKEKTILLWLHILNHQEFIPVSEQRSMPRTSNNLKGYLQLFATLVTIRSKIDFGRWDRHRQKMMSLQWFLKFTVGGI